MKIQRANMLIALQTVITYWSGHERALGYFTDSAFLAGMKQTYEAVKNGEQLVLVDE